MTLSTGKHIFQDASSGHSNAQWNVTRGHRRGVDQEGWAQIPRVARKLQTATVQDDMEEGQPSLEKTGAKVGRGSKKCGSVPKS